MPAADGGGGTRRPRQNWLRASLRVTGLLWDPGQAPALQSCPTFLRALHFDILTCSTPGATEALFPQDTASRVLPLVGLCSPEPGRGLYCFGVRTEQSSPKGWGLGRVGLCLGKGVPLRGLAPPTHWLSRAPSHTHFGLNFSLSTDPNLSPLFQFSNKPVSSSANRPGVLSLVGLPSTPRVGDTLHLRRSQRTASPMVSSFSTE